MRKSLKVKHFPRTETDYFCDSPIVNMAAHFTFQTWTRADIARLHEAKRTSRRLRTHHLECHRQVLHGTFVGGVDLQGFGK